MQTEVFIRYPVLRGYWYAVARSSDVAQGPLALTVLGERLVLWRTADGALKAARDRYAHREAPLSRGQVVEPPAVPVSCVDVWRQRRVCAHPVGATHLPTIA